MHQPIARRNLIVAAAFTTAATGAAAQPADEPAKVMERYAAALSAGDVEMLVALYTGNGVFMRPDLPAAAVGRAALRQAYKEIATTLKVNLKFTVEEVEEQGDIAWLRSTSRGRVKVIATGVENADTYHQLVVFRREQGAWKIRSYLYAPADPATPAKT